MFHQSETVNPFRFSRKAEQEIVTSGREIQSPQHTESRTFPGPAGHYAALPTHSRIPTDRSDWGRVRFSPFV